LPCLIKTVNLSKCFVPSWGLKSAISALFGGHKRGKITALKDINFEVQKGEVFGLMGPNGAGKTTVIKILSTLILPTSGTAYVNGYELISDPLRVRASIGLVSGDERCLYWRLTGRENLEFFAAFYNLPPKLARYRIHRLVKLLELDELDRRVSEYSTGMRQRLCLIRSLLHDPPILFLDEPTKSLDPLTSERLRVFIRDELSKGQGKTILLTTHNPFEAAQICDRVGIMEAGYMLASGGIQELRVAAGVDKDTPLQEVYARLLKQRCRS
jgi:ABC-2 type transport system ATP-binding protein